jgi:hypothetical protein
MEPEVANGRGWNQTAGTGDHRRCIWREHHSMHYTAVRLDAEPLVGTVVSATFAYQNHPQAHEVMTILGISLYQASLLRTIVSGDTSIFSFHRRASTNEILSIWHILH